MVWDSSERCPPAPEKGGRGDPNPQKAILPLQIMQEGENPRIHPDTSTIPCCEARNDKPEFPPGSTFPATPAGKKPHEASSVPHHFITSMPAAAAHISTLSPNTHGWWEKPPWGFSPRGCLPFWGARRHQGFVQLCREEA